MKSNLLDEYLSKIAQRVDWLVTTCSTGYSNMSARELAREHLNKELHSILLEVYEVGFVAGKKESDFNNDQKLRINKFKIENKVKSKLKKEILDKVIKEYSIHDERIKKNLIKKVIEDETDVEENN